MLIYGQNWSEQLYVNFIDILLFNSRKGFRENFKINGVKHFVKKKSNEIKYNTFQNISYLIPIVWKYSKLLFLYYGIYTVISSLSPFCGIFFSKFIIDELMNDKRLEVLIFLVVLFFIVSTVTGFLTSYFGNAYRPCVIKVRMNFIKNIRKNV